LDLAFEQLLTVNDYENPMESENPVDRCESRLIALYAGQAPPFAFGGTVQAALRTSI